MFEITRVNSVINESIGKVSSDQFEALYNYYRHIDDVHKVFWTNLETL